MGDVYVPQPVETLNNGDVVVKVADGTTPSQTLSVDSSGRLTTKLNDGAGNSVTSQASGGQRALDVGIDVAGVQIDPRQIRTLTSADIVTVDQGTSPWVTTAQNFPTTVDTNFGTVGASTLRSAAEIGNATGAADFNAGNPTAQTLRTASSLVVGGANVSNTNPVPVALATVSAGTYINKYNTTASVASGGTANHVYTITTGKTMTVRKFWATGSGKIRIDCQTSPDGSTYTTFWTGMSSPSDPNISIDLDTLAIQDSGTGSTIRIIVTNEDNKTFDVFSTISGVEA